MKCQIAVIVSCLCWLQPNSGIASEPIQSVDELVEAVKNATAGDVVQVAAGTFELTAPLEPASGVTLKGAGLGKTIITHKVSWKPSTEALPDPEMRMKGLNSQAYLIRIKDKSQGVTIENLTLLGPAMHGAVFAFAPDKLHIHHVRIEDTLWSGIRTLAMTNAKIHDCEFVDAGGCWKRGGIPSDKGGITGGAIFAVWMKDSEIAHNRFWRTQQGHANHFYGVKVRQAKRCRVHHNTINANFSMEFPFENDEDNEIDHNVCYGTISIPKYAGGAVPQSGKTFHIHHNWMHSSYAIEFVRNGVEIDHNLFDFDVAKDGGNMISGFGKADAKGPASFHHNMVSNPGRGVIWINEVYNNFEIYNNHVVARTTSTPRTEGLFAFNGKCDFSTIAIRNNVVECIGTPRPLLRSSESYAAKIENNRLKNVADVAKLSNPQTDEQVGLADPLSFRCGAHGEFQIEGWNATAVELPE